MNQTTNYKLNQWQRHDRVLMDDFNADNEKIDAALKAEADTRTAAVNAINAALAKRGNCRMELLTYTGTGTYGRDNPTRIRFSAKPALFIAVGDRALLIGRGGVSPAYATMYNLNYNSTSMVPYKIAWSGNEMSLAEGTNAYEQLNASGVSYWVLALYDMN